MNIYEYDDFRLYLKDCYEERRRQEPDYSYRKFAADASISNPGFFNDVIKGRRKLSKAAIEKMIVVFALSEVEAEFFRMLVAYRQSKNELQQQELYKKILFRRNRSSFARLNPALNKYYQDFHYPLVRAAVMAMDFRGDYDALGRFIIPPIPSVQVKKYVRDLCDWGMVRQESDGRYAVTDRVVEPPEKLRDQVKQINREWIVQAIDPLMKLPSDKRHVSSMLISISSGTRTKIRERIESFREEIWTLVKNDPAVADAIMLLNIQYVPKSKRSERV